MVYVDTSVLVALHTREAMTQVVQDWYGAVGSTTLATATLAITEFASALGIKQRTRQLSAREAKVAWTSFSDQYEAELYLIDSDRVNFIDAAELIRTHATGLRTRDALHLSVARRTGVASLASLDSVMNRTARKLGMTVELGLPR